MFLTLWDWPRLNKHLFDNAPSVGILRCSKNLVDARDKNIQQRAESLSLDGASEYVSWSFEKTIRSPELTQHDMECELVSGDAFLVFLFFSSRYGVVTPTKPSSPLLLRSLTLTVIFSASKSHHSVVLKVDQWKHQCTLILTLIHRLYYPKASGSSGFPVNDISISDTYWN